MATQVHTVLYTNAPKCFKKSCC